jgi:hypothetical protein
MDAEGAGTHPPRRGRYLPACSPSPG